MKLGMDCVRDIMLCVEQQVDFRTICKFIDPIEAKVITDWLESDQIDIPSYQRQLSNTYGTDKILYHVRYCIDAGLMRVDSNSATYEYVIADLTPEGHEFIANIRENTQWAKVKTGAKNVGTSSLKILIQLAAGIAQQAAQKYLGLI